MKIDGRIAPLFTRMSLTRGLVCVLLAGIIYAVTFGSVHGPLSSVQAVNNTSAELAGNIAIDHGNAASFSSDDLLRREAHSHECLICVLRQQLFNSVLPSPHFIVRPSTEADFVSTPKIFYHSRSFTSSHIARLSGARAPPIDRA